MAVRGKIEPVYRKVSERGVYRVNKGRQLSPLSVFSPDGSTAIYLVFMLIGLVGYFCVPTVANWVVQAGGMGAYNRNMNNTAGKAANVGGAVAGASTGNVAGVLLKK